MSIRFSAALLLSAITLSACASSGSSTYSTSAAREAEKAHVAQLHAQGKISNEESSRRQYEITKRYHKLDSADEAYWATVISNAQLRDQERITSAQHDALDADAAAVRDARKQNARASAAAVYSATRSRTCTYVGYVMQCN